MNSPALFFTFIVLTIAGLQVFTEVYTAFFGAGSTGAESPDAALMNVVYLFRQAFEFFNIGFASAMAWLLFALIMLVTAVQFLVSRRFVFYQGTERR
jgi:multiple sugar transport system permease protein